MMTWCSEPKVCSRRRRLAVTVPERLAPVDVGEHVRAASLPRPDVAA